MRIVARKRLFSRTVDFIVVGPKKEWVDSYIMRVSYEQTLGTFSTERDAARYVEQEEQRVYVGSLLMRIKGRYSEDQLMALADGRSI